MLQKHSWTFSIESSNIIMWFLFHWVQCGIHMNIFRGCYIIIVLRLSWTLGIIRLPSVVEETGYLTSLVNDHTNTQYQQSSQYAYGYVEGSLFFVALWKNAGLVTVLFGQVTMMFKLGSSYKCLFVLPP